MSERMIANLAVKEGLKDLLQGLKVVRDRLDGGRHDEAKQILEQVGHRMAYLINSLVVDQTPRR